MSIYLYYLHCLITCFVLTTVTTTQLLQILITTVHSRVQVHHVHLCVDISLICTLCNNRIYPVKVNFIPFRDILWEIDLSSVATWYFFKSIILFFENRPNYTFLILLYFFYTFFCSRTFLYFFFQNRWFETFYAKRKNCSRLRRSH